MPDEDPEPGHGSSSQASAYGGPGWTPRPFGHREEIGNLWGACGIDSEWRALRAVLLHRPGEELAASADPDAVQMLAPLDIGQAQAEHDALAAAYEAAGVTVHRLEPEGIPRPNQMFCADLLFMTPEGAILARPASMVRAGEERQVARRLAALGIPIVRTLRGTATFEGADALWLDPKTVLIGCGLRTNADGAMQVAQALEAMGVAAIVVDLPYGTMHLMGILRIVDRELALAWPRRLAVAAVEALMDRGYGVAFLPDETDRRESRALNLVALGPRRVLMPAGHPEIQAFYESHGIACRAVAVSELSKAAGAVGCLTGVLQRESA